MLRILLRAPEYQPSACLQRFSWLHLFHSLFFIVIIVFAWLQGFSWVPNISVMVSLNPPRAFTTSIPRTVFPSLKHTYRWEMWRTFTSLLLGCISSLMFTWLHSQTIFYRWADSQSTNMLIQWQTVIIISCYNACLTKYANMWKCVMRCDKVWQNVTKFETCMSQNVTKIETCMW